MDGGRIFTTDTLGESDYHVSFAQPYVLLHFFNLNTHARFSAHVLTSYVDTVLIDLGSHELSISPAWVDSISTLIDQLTASVHSALINHPGLRSGPCSYSEISEVIEVIDVWTSRDVSFLPGTHHSIMSIVALHFEHSITDITSRDAYDSEPSLYTAADTLPLIPSLQAYCMNTVERAFALLYAHYRCPPLVQEHSSLEDCFTRARVVLSADNMSLLILQSVLYYMAWYPENFTCGSFLHSFFLGQVTDDLDETSFLTVQQLQLICTVEQLQELGSFIHVVDTSGTRSTFNLQTDSTYVFHFWGTWCAPCMESFSESQAFDSTLASRGINVISVCFDAQPHFPRWLSLVDGISYPQLFVSYAINEPDRLPLRLQVNSYPYYVVWKEGAGVLYRSPFRSRVGEFVLHDQILKGFNADR